MARILITRAQPEADDTAMAAAAAGHGTVVAPLFTVRLLKPDLRTPLGAYAGILLTSRNAVRGFLNGFRPDPDMLPPVFTVGRRTAALAQAHGLPIAGDADGDAAALADLLIARRAPRPPGPLLHPGGLRVGPGLTERLSAAGFRLDHVATYAVEAYDTLPVAARRGLEKRTVDTALFFSPRSADIFARLVRTSGLAEACRSLTGVCISQATADRLAAGLPELQRLTVAAHPSLDGLISALGTGPSDASPGRPAAVMARPLDDGAEDGADTTIMVEKDAARSNATDAVITAFGGLRPMAKALGITASTVQGWKKRGAIPENRHDAIRQAADKAGVTLDATVLAASAPAPDAEIPAEPPAAAAVAGKPEAVAAAKAPPGPDDKAAAAPASTGSAARSAAESPASDAASTPPAGSSTAASPAGASTAASPAGSSTAANPPAARTGSVPGTRGGAASGPAPATGPSASPSPASKSASAVASSSPSPAKSDPATKTAASDTGKGPESKSAAAPAGGSKDGSAKDGAGKADRPNSGGTEKTAQASPPADRKGGGGDGQSPPPTAPEKSGGGGAALATVALLVGAVGVASPWWAPLVRDPAVPVPVERSLADLGDRVDQVESALPQADLNALTERVAALEDSVDQALSAPASDGDGSGDAAAGGGTDPARVEALSDQIARLGERLDTVAADADTGDLAAGVSALDNQIDTVTDRLAGVTETLGLLRTRIEALEAVSTADSSLRGAVGDLADRVDGLSDRTDRAVARLEDLAGQVSAETAADTTTQAMMLAVGQLRSALDQGRAFLAPLTTLASVAGAEPALDEAVTMLMPVSTTGVKTRDQLVAEFPNIVRAVREAETIGEDAAWYRRALASLQELVTVRPAPGEVPGTDPDAILARAEGRLDRGNMDGAIEALSELEGRPLAAAAVWIAEARNRLDAEIALDRLTEAAIVRLGVEPPTAPAATTDAGDGSTGEEG